MSKEQKQSFAGIAAVLFLAVMVAFLAIVSQTGVAADLSGRSRTSLGAGYTVKIVDLGDYHAPAQYNADYQWYHVHYHKAGITATKSHYAIIELGDTVIFPHPAGATKIIVKSCKIQQTHATGSGAATVYLGVVTAQDGATSGDLMVFHTQSSLMTAAAYAGRYDFEGPLDLTTSAGGTPEYFIGPRVAAGTSLGDNDDITAVDGNTTRAAVGDVIMQVNEGVAMSLTIDIDCIYRTE